jgi:Spy/CpxP family protein refolding chaperone
MITLRTVLTLTAAALLAAPALRAQEQKPAGERPNRRAAAGRPQLDPAARLKELTEKLSLTAEQQEKVKAVFARNVEKLKAMREDKAATPATRREKFMEMRKAELEEINAILTPEQQGKYKELQRDQRQRAAGAGAARRGQNPPPK